MASRPCPNCGHPLSPDARFCPHCGRDGSDVLIAVDTTDQRVPWRALEGLAIYLLSFVLMAIIVFIAALVEDDKDVLTIVAVIAQGAALFVVTVGWVRLIHRRRVRALGLHVPSGGDIGIGLGVGAGAIFGSMVVTGLVIKIAELFTTKPVKSPDQIGLDRDPTGWFLVALGFSVIVVAPVAEELFFRGFLYRGLRRWARVGPSVVVSAVIFGVVHVIPLIIPAIAILGAVLAILVEWRGNIVPAIVAHATFNLFGFVVLFLI